MCLNLINLKCEVMQKINFIRIFCCEYLTVDFLVVGTQFLGVLIRFFSHFENAYGACVLEMCPWES
jgi:hypothetical protein